MITSSGVNPGQNRWIPRPAECALDPLWLWGWDSDWHVVVAAADPLFVAVAAWLVFVGATSVAWSVDTPSAHPAKSTARVLSLPAESLGGEGGGERACGGGRGRGGGGRGGGGACGAGQ